MVALSMLSFGPMTMMALAIGSAMTRVLPTSTETGALSTVGPLITSAREPVLVVVVEVAVSLAAEAAVLPT